MNDWDRIYNTAMVELELIWAQLETNNEESGSQTGQQQGAEVSGPAGGYATDNSGGPERPGIPAPSGK